MNKKHLIALGLMIAVSGNTFAQNSKIKEANKAYDLAYLALVSKKYDQAEQPLMAAKAAADEATVHPETQNNASAWLAKAAVYVAMMELPKYQGSDNYKVSYEAFKKAVSLDPKIDKKDGVPRMLMNMGIMAFNEGISAYNNNSYPKALENFEIVKNSIGYKNGELLKTSKDADTIAAQANLYTGFGSYYTKKYDDAIARLTEASKNPITTDMVDVYRVIAMSYAEKGDKAKQLQTIEAAKVKFPNNNDITNDELNYYVVEDKQDVLITKFEEAFTKNPSNALIANNLGLLYSNLAIDKNYKTNDKSDGYLKKSEEYYKKALELDANNPSYLYNFGNHFATLATLHGRKMNALSTSAADQAKYDVLSKQRIAYMTQALSYLEKSAGIYESMDKSGRLSGNDATNYVDALDVMSKIFANQNKMDKSTEIKAKIEAIKNKYK